MWHRRTRDKQMRTGVGALSLAMALSMSVSLAGSAGAQEEPAGDGNPSPKVKVERTATGQKVFRITEGFVVEGRIQKPNAFYILNRSNLGYEVMDLRRSFLPDLVRTVQHDPF